MALVDLMRITHGIRYGNAIPLVRSEFKEEDIGNHITHKGSHGSRQFHQNGAEVRSVFQGEL